MRVQKKQELPDRGSGRSSSQRWLARSSRGPRACNSAARVPGGRCSPGSGAGSAGPRARSEASRAGRGGPRAPHHRILAPAGRRGARGRPVQGAAWLGGHSAGLRGRHARIVGSGEPPLATSWLQALPGWRPAALPVSAGSGRVDRPARLGPRAPVLRELAGSPASHPCRPGGRARVNIGRPAGANHSAAGTGEELQSGSAASPDARWVSGLLKGPAGSLWQAAWRHQSDRAVPSPI